MKHNEFAYAVRYRSESVFSLLVCGCYYSLVIAIPSFLSETHLRWWHVKG